MSKISDAIGEFFGESIALVIGWGFCMAMMGGCFALGFWLAPYFGGDRHRDAFGILSALVFIWNYEGRRADQRWGRLRDMISHLGETEHR